MSLGLYEATPLSAAVPADLGEYGYVERGVVRKRARIDEAFAERAGMTHAGCHALSGLYRVEVQRLGRDGTPVCQFQCFSVEKPLDIGATVSVPHYRDTVPGWGRVVALVPDVEQKQMEVSCAN